MSINLGVAGLSPTDDSDRSNMQHMGAHCCPDFSHRSSMDSMHFTTPGSLGQGMESVRRLSGGGVFPAMLEHSAAAPHSTGVHEAGLAEETAADTFDETGLLFPFAPPMNDDADTGDAQ